jgi:hypothetical protein
VGGTGLGLSSTDNALPGNSLCPNPTADLAGVGEELN